MKRLGDPSIPPSALPSDSESLPRWELIRDVAIFQLKLFLDAFRDLIMSPISLMAAAVDLMGRRDGSTGNFQKVLEIGRATDRWINLFGQRGAEEEAPAKEVTVDHLMSQVESLIVDQYQRGGLTASAKEAIDRSLDRIVRDRDE